MAKKLQEEIKKILLKMESEIDESEVISKKGKLKGAPTNISGKIYRDTFGIRREGSIYTNPNAVIVNTLKKGIHSDWSKIKIGTTPEKLNTKQFIRRAKVRTEFRCCYNGNPQNDPIQIDVELEDIYNNKKEAYKNNNLQDWLYDAFRESMINISDEECNDWNDAYTPCEKSRKLLQILRKATEGYEGIDEGQLQKEAESYKKQREQIQITRQKAKEKAEQKYQKEMEKLSKQRKPTIETTIPVTIDNIPTTITTKKDLSTLDVILISRLYKHITTLENAKKEQEEEVQMYIDRIKTIEETNQLDNLLPSIKKRDEWLDEIRMTNIKIQRQQEAISKIKGG